MLVSGVTVEHQMQRDIVRELPVEQPQDADELLMPVALESLAAPPMFGHTQVSRHLPYTILGMFRNASSVHVEYSVIRASASLCPCITPEPLC